MAGRLAGRLAVLLAGYPLSFWCRKRPAHRHTSRTGSSFLAFHPKYVYAVRRPHATPHSFWLSTEPESQAERIAALALPVWLVFPMASGGSYGSKVRHCDGLELRFRVALPAHHNIWRPRTHVLASRRPNRSCYTPVAPGIFIVSS